MKAAVLFRQNSVLDILELDMPKLDIGQVLVRVEHSGICGKQIDEITGRQGEDPFLPHLLGHEGGGEVLEVGPGVRKVKKGDRVVMHWMKGSGIDALPPRYLYRGRTISAGGVTTFSEMTIASENRLTPVETQLGSDELSLLGCAVTTGVGIVLNDANFRPGQTLAVFGAGGVGLSVIKGAQLVNAIRVVAIDVHAGKLARATQCGATDVIDASKTDVDAALKEMTRGAGFDVAVDTTGMNAVRLSAYNATARQGVTILAGVPFAGERMAIDSFPLHAGRRIVGSHGGGTVPDRDIPRYVNLCHEGRLTIRDLITHRFSLGDVNQAIDAVRFDATCARCVIQMGR